jgi:hypothetical protein
MMMSILKTGIEFPDTGLINKAHGHKEEKKLLLR